MNQEIIRLSVSEAAKFFGLEQRTVRRALKDGKLNYVVSRGRYKISFISLLKWSRQKTTLRNKLAKRGMGQFVERWKITNPHYSPNPANLKLDPQHADNQARPGETPARPEQPGDQPDQPKSNARQGSAT